MQHRWVRNIPVACASLALVAVALAQRADFPPSGLAKGIQLYREKSWQAAASTLQAVPARLPQLADYASYHHGLAQMELKNYPAAATAFQLVYNHQPLSPYAWRAVLAAATSLIEAGRAKEALALLKQHYKKIPPANAEFALAKAYEALEDSVSAAVSYQRVHYQYPVSDPAADAALALYRLRTRLGEKFPPPMAQQLMARATALATAKRYAEAKKELESSLTILGGADRDIAKVRIGAMDYQSKQLLPAYRYLRTLSVATEEADAERLYHLTYVAKRLDREDDMQAHLRELAAKYPASPWRMEALITAAYIYLNRNELSAYEPLYQACAETFANHAQASFCDWKLTWARYLSQPQQAEALLRAHLKRYPASEKMPASLYFLARQAELRRDYSSAKVYYAQLNNHVPNHYYSMLAAERLGAPMLAQATPSTEVQSFLAAISFPNRKATLNFTANRATSLRLERARLLSAASLTDLAEMELRFAARNDGQPQIIALELAKLLEKRGATDEALRAVKAYVPNYLNVPLEGAPLAFWRVAFPLPYRDSVERYARERELDPYILAGLIRQESEFNPKALSHAKAYGLTQVLPSTGRFLSRKNGISRFVPSMLYEPEINLKLGTVYLRQMLDNFRSRWEHTLAAYNGGPTRVNRWIQWATFREPSEFIETIPITETRDYVQIVLRNASVYRRLYGQTAAALPSGDTSHGYSVASGSR